MAAKKAKWTKTEKRTAKRELEAWIAGRKALLIEQVRKLRASVKQQISAKRAELAARMRGPRPGAKPPAKAARAPAPAKRAGKKKAARAAKARGAKKRAPPAPARAAAPPQLLEALAPGAQAKAIKLAATRAEPFLEGSRRFIASTWDVMRREGSTRLTLDAFKELLIELSRSGELAITRLDLVGAADNHGQRALMNRSETLRHGYGGHVSEFHLIAIDR